MKKKVSLHCPGCSSLPSQRGTDCPDAGRKEASQVLSAHQRPHVCAPDPLSKAYRGDSFPMIFTKEGEEQA